MAKKGEVNELKQLLQSTFVGPLDPIRQRQVVQKVIAYMTLGIDVSPLISDMIMVRSNSHPQAGNTKDMIQKKLVNLFLCTYAASHPDISLLAVNTLQRDARHENPMIRGLALRSITSLRYPKPQIHELGGVLSKLSTPTQLLRSFSLPETS